MGKHTEDMPKDVKVVWGIGIGVFVASGIVILGIPLAILLIAFPQVLFVIAFLGILLIGSLIHAKAKR